MEFFNQPDFALTGMAIAIVMLAVVSILLFRSLRQTRNIVKAFQNNIEQTQSDVGALCAGSVGIARRLNRIEKRLRIQNERQDRLEMHEPNYQTYGQAVRLAKKGADLDELVSTCGLSRGEAELIVMLNHDAVQH